MKHVFYEEFDRLISDYKNPTTREASLIKHKLDSILALYDACSVEEREFADEITLEFSRIIALLKNQHQKEMLTLMQENRSLKSQGEGSGVAYMPGGKDTNESIYEYDYEILEAFYNYFKGDRPLLYHEIEQYQFSFSEERRSMVNLTILDYCNRIKTYAKKYLHEIYPEESIPMIIHGDDAEDYQTFEPIVFIYNNLELILAKMKTTNENGETVKQRLNIRSALRKLNEFKQERGYK